MKNNVMPSVVQIDSENLKSLVTEVKETVATDLIEKYSVKRQKAFGIIDLWMCHKMMKTAASRRRY